LVDAGVDDALAWRMMDVGDAVVDAASASARSEEPPSSSKKQQTSQQKRNTRDKNK
jgi:hypothetical protein